MGLRDLTRISSISQCHIVDGHMQGTFNPVIILIGIPLRHRDSDVSNSKVYLFYVVLTAYPICSGIFP